MKQKTNKEILIEIFYKAKSGTVTKNQWRNMILAQVAAILVSSVLIPKPLLLVVGIVTVFYIVIDPLYDAITNSDMSNIVPAIVDRILALCFYPATTAYSLTK